MWPKALIGYCSVMFSANAGEPREKMKENVLGQIRFCDEYERLLEEFLQSLTKWKECQGNEGRARTAKTTAEIELMLSKQEYVRRLIALQGHSRKCSVCEETLRAQINVVDRSASAAGTAVT